jgi:predicted O-methyltransferase YrrM
LWHDGRLRLIRLADGQLMKSRPSILWLLHRFGLHSAGSQTTGDERRTLQEFAAGRRRLAEIGVYQGVTTSCLASVMSPQGRYFAIDPYPPGRMGVNFDSWIASNEVSRGAKGSVHWIRAIGAEAARNPQVQSEPFDFLFIDGDHSYEGLRSDWEAWRPLIAPGGIVGLHDTRGNHFACQQYMEEVIVPDPEFRVVAEVERLTVFERVHG